MLTYLVGSKTSGVLEARYKDYNYKYLTATTNLDSRELSYYAGLDWEATAKTTGKVRLGYLNKKFSKANQAKKGMFSWELGVDWEPMSYSTWSLNTSQQAQENDGSGTYLKVTNAKVGWNHEWNSYTSHDLSFAYTESKYVGGTRKDKISDAHASVNYQWQRWLAIQPAYDFSNRSSNLATAKYRQNIWSINLIGTL